MLSFNYTGTYENYYGEFLYEIDYTHGKAAIENTVDNNNMVLGIDEYLKEDEKNENIEFIEFKKYFFSDILWMLQIEILLREFILAIEFRQQFFM